jgi:predicted branched-subunit amino acid permease
MKSNFITRHRAALVRGFKDGIPIGLGYLAVSFSLGIVAANAGLSVLQSFLVSALCNASAGEYAGIISIAANASYLEIAVVTLITNARYLLMSCALSQRIAPGTRLCHRLFTGFYITDELFGISVAGDGYLDPYYMYGAVSVAAPGWAFGTALGALAGNVLPLRIVSALSVALYGMFLAIIIPPAKKSKVVAGIIIICFAASYASSKLPFISELSAGTRTVILTVVISAAAALLFPRNEGEDAA